MKFGVLISVLFLGLAVTSPLNADLVNEGMRAYSQGDYKKALEILQPRAEEGNYGAQYYLGEMYLEGRGVPQNTAKALELFRAAAEGNRPYPQYRLGAMHAAGNGVKKDPKTAYMWFELAASFGLEKAANRRHALEKELSPQDIAEAKKMAEEWLKKHPHFSR